MIAVLAILVLIWRLDQKSDRDGDGLPDSWEQAHPCLDYLVPDAGLDDDGDGLINLEEYQKGTDPCDADTDGDQMDDEYEVDHGCLNALVPDADSDPDGDHRSNENEYILDTDPCAADGLRPQPELTGFNDHNPLQTRINQCLYLVSSINIVFPYPLRLLVNLKVV